MVKKKTRKHKSTKRCRTALEIEEEQSRTLYIRLPKTIKDVEEVRALFSGDFRIKTPRQSSRHCHVIFPSIEDKIKNLKEVAQKKVDGKRVVAAPPRPINLNKPKKQKKIKIPEPPKEPNVPKYLFVTNLPPGIKGSEVKDAFHGATTVALLKGLVKNTKRAKVKMAAPHLSLDYVKNKDKWPIFNGKKCKISFSESKRKSKKKKKSLEVYDGESETKDGEKSFDKEEKKISEDEDNDTDNSDEEQSNVEEVKNVDESIDEEEEENESEEQEEEESDEESSE